MAAKTTAKASAKPTPAAPKSAPTPTAPKPMAAGPKPVAAPTPTASAARPNGKHAATPVVAEPKAAEKKAAKPRGNGVSKSGLLTAAFMAGATLEQALAQLQKHYPDEKMGKAKAQVRWLERCGYKIITAANGTITATR